MVSILNHVFLSLNSLAVLFGRDGPELFGLEHIIELPADYLINTYK